MSGQTTSSRQIAKNTVIMYIRMFIMMIIGLYTSRIILNTLGVSDYGIYNVVGGVVAMFAIISSSLSSSISRFLTFELGRNDNERLKEIFSTAVIVQFVISLIIVVLIEIIGVWFLNYKMNIPEGRMEAANFAMQCSIASFALGLNNTPYSASIVAHERFGLFAYLTLLDAILKLIVVFALSISPFDKLKTYAFLLLAVTIIVQIIYLIYCRINFSECRFNFKYNPVLLKEMGNFAGWSFFGNASWILNTQGINILINLFFGVTINAARGISTQVNAMVESFVNNFMTALNPQITKSYAAGDYEYMHKLVYTGARYSYFLMLFFSIPICLETHQILLLWLKQVPEYSVPFVRLTLISTMVFVLGNTLTTSQSATGKIKKSAIVTSIFTFIEFPFTYILFKLGYSPISTYLIHLLIYFSLVFIKIYLVKDFIQITYYSYVQNVLLKSASVTCASLIIPLLIINYMPETNLRLLILCFISFISSAICIYYLGMHKKERQYMVNILKNKLINERNN